MDKSGQTLAKHHKGLWHDYAECMHAISESASFVVGLVATNSLGTNFMNECKYLDLHFSYVSWFNATIESKDVEMYILLWVKSLQDRETFLR